jgi:hypothetical protein
VEKDFETRRRYNTLIREIGRAQRTTLHHVAISLHLVAARCNAAQNADRSVGRRAAQRVEGKHVRMYAQHAHAGEQGLLASSIHPSGISFRIGAAAHSAFIGRTSCALPPPRSFAQCAAPERHCHSGGVLVAIRSDPTALDGAAPSAALAGAVDATWLLS